MAASAGTARIDKLVKTKTKQPDGANGSTGNTAYVSEPDAIRQALKVLRDQRAGVQLNFEGDSIAYSAQVLDVSESEFLLENIVPRDGLKKMRKGQEFSMSARAQGIYVHSGSNTVIAVDSERGVPFFRVGLPTTLLYQQRRRSARFQLPTRVPTKGASVELFREKTDRKSRDESLTGRIIDISAGGCRAEFDTAVAVPLAQDEQIRCAIEIPNLLEFHAEAAIRHSSYDARKRTLSCGIELTEMHVTDRRRLEQFIESIRRSTQRG